jgi:glyoxylase-like metal-dependent hydrolase (beta-lactamase superfamily II)
MKIKETKKLIVERFVVGMIEVNCYLVFNKENKNLYVIDSGDEAEKIIKNIKKFDYEQLFLIQTHCHVDHITALGEVFDKTTPNALYIHTKEIPLYKSDDNHLMPYMPKANNLPEPSKNFVSEDFEIIETPGHTQGGVCFYFKDDNLLFTGDTLFKHSIGRTDLKGGNHQQLLSSIKKNLLTLPNNTVIYPGHGPESKIEDEKKYNPYL